VSIALQSARLASHDLIPALEHDALDHDGLGEHAFDTFERTMRRGTKHWYEFICLYYRLNVLFSHFIANPSYRLDVLKLLQGDVYDEEPPAVLAHMRAMVAKVEANPKHMWHGLLGQVAASGLREAADPVLP
jgi:FADH2 O2-dependent halogenase